MFYGVGIVSLINLLAFLYVMREMQFGMASSKRGAEAVVDEAALAKHESHLADGEKARLSYA
ncbi:hypothetical protein H310_11145 [Aphanomyces invadans]|nr:hypothetical protein H310_11145 [Aphanomyces invadans]ETV95238.1 hypothetical protein H310_11145 [Aphanomyces invadans]|eukprot:XP_008875939.1 hypothetical protein H310_11145 [Aphanomyces invadans]